MSDIYTYIKWMRYVTLLFLLFLCPTIKKKHTGGHSNTARLAVPCFDKATNTACLDNQARDTQKQEYANRLLHNQF